LLKFTEYVTLKQTMKFIDSKQRKKSDEN